MFGVKRKFRVVYLFILKKSEYKREVKNKKKKKKKKHVSETKCTRKRSRKHGQEREKALFALEEF